MSTADGAPDGEHPTTKHNVRVIQQDLTDTLSGAAADVALEPPDSGDFYETFAIPDGSGDVGLFIGDVTGHGAPAARKAQAIRADAIAHLKSGDSPLTTVEAANAIHDGEDDRYSTLFVAKVNGETGAVTYANAGHDSPFLTSPNGNVVELETTGPPLGVLPPGSEQYEEQHAHIVPGGTLTVATDGITEARVPQRNPLEFFGYERVRSIVTKLRNFSPADIVRAVINHVLVFTKSTIGDDIAVMAIRRRLRKPFL